MKEKDYEISELLESIISRLEKYYPEMPHDIVDDLRKASDYLKKIERTEQGDEIIQEEEFE
jgi:hypothetical protein